jgi:hypothetical protein
MPHCLIRLEQMLWIGHILNMAHLTFILRPESSFLLHPFNILLFSLLNLYLSIVSEKQVDSYPLSFCCDKMFCALCDVPSQNLSILHH